MTNYFLPQIDGCEFVGRYVKNVLGVEEIATIPKAWWDYYDWCVGQEIDMEEWVQDIDSMRPQDISFSEYLWGSLWQHECTRYFHGYPCPPSAPPVGYVDFLKNLDKEENSKANNEEIGRHLTNALGVEEVVVMQGKYWRYFDWLAELGGDMNKWVVDADLDRHRTGKTLSDEMMASLKRHERKSYFEHGKFPLFISPKGYSE